MEIQDFIKAEDKRYAGVVDLSTDLIIPDSDGLVCRFKGKGSATIDMLSDDLSAGGAWELKKGVDITDKDNFATAQNGLDEDISGTLVVDEMTSLTVYGNIGDYFYIKFGTSTGTVKYRINVN